MEATEPKGPYRPPDEETDELPSLYYFLSGVLLAGAIAAIAAVLGSRRQRKKEESEREAEETWNAYERKDDRSEMNIINEPRRQPRQTPPQRRARPPTHPPEQWGYEGRRVSDGDDDEAESYDPYDHYT